MRNLVLIALIFSASLFQKTAFCQEQEFIVPEHQTNVNPTDSPKVIVWVEEMPEFPGGDSARVKFITDNIVYPQIAKEKGIEGTVYVKFVVEMDGSITNVEVLRGVSTELDKEAVRVVSIMPKWKPGTLRRKPVRTQFNMPVKFSLKTSEEPPVQNPSKSDQDDVFVFVEVQAEFPGGEEARFKFLQQNIIYPEIAKEQNEKGTVYLKFVIEKDGSITNVTIMRGVSPSIDAEAIRVIQMMPKWKPATQRGKEVRVWFNLPIKFDTF
jgi:TonB family protein